MLAHSEAPTLAQVLRGPLLQRGGVTQQAKSLHLQGQPQQTTQLAA